MAIEPIIDPLVGGRLVPRVGGLALLIGAGALCYFGCAFLFGAFRWSEVKTQLLRRRG